MQHQKMIDAGKLPSALQEFPADIQHGTHRAKGGVVTVLVPAHNEAEAIIDTLESLGRQTRRPDRVIVIADNCTDATVQLAADFGAEVISTVGNTDKKAGALNFALNGILADADPDDLILVQDADSQLSPDFIENAVRHLSANDNLGAVGGVFAGVPVAGSLVTCSAMSTHGTPGM